MSPWLSTPWCLLMAMVTIGGAGQDLRERKPVHAALGLASGAVCVMSVLAYGGAAWIQELRLLLPSSCIASAGWLLYEAIDDYRSVELDPELSAEENEWLRFAAALAVIVLFAPALVLGTKVGLAAWR